MPRQPLPITARDEECVPIGGVDRLIARENPVRVWREHRGYSLRQLGERAGIGIGYLSQIENGERKGTVDTLKKIAAALDVDLDDPERGPPLGFIATRPRILGRMSEA